MDIDVFARQVDALADMLVDDMSAEDILVMQVLVANLRSQIANSNPNAREWAALKTTCVLLREIDVELFNRNEIGMKVHC